MTTQVETVFQDAMALNAADRLTIAERLLETLEPDTELIADDEWAAELKRRSEEFASDSSVGIPWQQLRDEA